jgi:retinol dehydrogenase 14
VRTAARGAATSIYLASSPQVDGVTGRYFANRKDRTSSRFSYDAEAAARLWQVSANLVGLPPQDRMPEVVIEVRPDNVIVSPPRWE